MRNSLTEEEAETNSLHCIPVLLPWLLNYWKVVLLSDFVAAALGVRLEFSAWCYVVDVYIR